MKLEELTEEIAKKTIEEKELLLKAILDAEEVVVYGCYGSDAIIYGDEVYIEEYEDTRYNPDKTTMNFKKKRLAISSRICSG